MRVADLYRIESLRAHCLEIALNRHVYWPMIEHLRGQRESEDTLQTLIAADAPLEMMQVLFGLIPATTRGCVAPSWWTPPLAGRQNWMKRARTNSGGLVEPGRG